MQRKACCWIVALVAGCSIGAPPGFSDGDRWTFPLVGPLEDGLLVTPVTVRGHGPYLFAIDPDANVTAVDQQVAVDAGLLVGSGPRRIDESETGRIRFYAELIDLKIAHLTIDRRNAMVFPNGMYDTEGRHISGILGRDVLADSLVFGFDRDQGIATLTTVKAFQAPPEAIAIKYEVVSSRSSGFVASRAAVGSERSVGDALYREHGPIPSVSPTIDPSRPPNQTPAYLKRVEDNDNERRLARARPTDLGAVVPVPRRLARAQVGGASFALHLDLGAVTSQLPVSSWNQARVAPREARLRIVDEAASARDVEQAGTASSVTLGGAKAEQVAFVPFVDKRWGSEGVDGALGLDFFQPYAVHANWDRSTYYLKPRGDAAALTTARLGRWGGDLMSCPHAGCITTELVAGAGETVALRVARDAQATNRPLEVFLGATAAGKTLASLVVELPGGAVELFAALPPAYAGATLAVLDASPFPRSCTGDRGCVVVLGGPLIGRLELSPQLASPPVASPSEPGPAASAAAPRTVALDKLRRVAGSATIAPRDDVRQAAGDRPLAAVIVKVCLRPDGKVDTTRIVKSSGVPAYDEQLQSTIKATWAFEPVEIDGKPAAICVSATFVEPALSR